MIGTRHGTTDYPSGHAITKQLGMRRRRPRLRPRAARADGGCLPRDIEKGPGGPREMETPCMSGTAYPPTDCTAVLSAMGSLTAGFGMGPGDPPLHGSAHAGRSPARDAYHVFNPGATLGVAWRSANLFSLISDREDESR